MFEMECNRTVVSSVDVVVFTVVQRLVHVKCPSALPTVTTCLKLLPTLTGRLSALPTVTACLQLLPTLTGRLSALPTVTAVSYTHLTLPTS